MEGRPGDTGAVGPTVSMNEERMRKGLEDLEKKVREYKRIYIHIVIIVIMILYMKKEGLCCSNAFTIEPFKNRSFIMFIRVQQ